MQGKNLVVLIGVAVLALACEDALAPRPPQLRPPRKVSPTMQALSPVSANLPVTGGSKVLIVNWPYREGVQVARTYSGLTSITSDPRNSPLIRAYTGTVDYRGIHVDGVWQFCAISASVRSRGTDAPGAGACPATDPSQISSYTDTAIVGDSIFAVRSGAVPENPGDCTPSPSCYAYSGSTTLTLTPLPADLDLRGGSAGQIGRTVFVPAFTPSNGYATVVFTDSALPRGRPFQAKSWSWRRGDPQATPDHYWGTTDIVNSCPTRVGGPPYTSNGCSVAIKESGVLTSTARVNGLDHTDSACVQCAIGDSLLDMQAVRTALMQMMDSTHANATNLDQRREQVGAIIRDSLTGQITVLTAIQDSSDRCNSYWHPIAPGSGYTVVGYMHTHPISAGERYACPDHVHSTTGDPGPSTTDRDTRAQVNSNPAYVAAGWNPTWYVLSKDGVFRMDAAFSRASRRSLTEWYHGLCAWISFDARDAIIRRN
jgi:hypothetical protein